MASAVKDKEDKKRRRKWQSIDSWELNEEIRLGSHGHDPEMDDEQPSTSSPVVQDDPEPRRVSFGSVKRISWEVPNIPAAAKNERQHQLEEDPVTPYWEVELLKGPEHLKKHEYEFRQYKMRQRRVFDFLRRKSSVYITSGGDDMSIRSYATMFHGPNPPTFAAGLSTFNGVERVLVLPKEVVEDAIFPCNSTVRRFFVLVNGHGHNLCRIEEEEGPKRVSKPNLLILDFFLGVRLGKFIRKGATRSCKELMEVYSPPKHFLGSVEHVKKRRPTFHVKDKGGAILFQIELTKPLWFPKFRSASKLLFGVKGPDGKEHQGTIRSDWDDLTYILYLSHFLYGIALPMGMAVEQKFLLTAATLMVYYAYFDGKILKQIVHIPKNSTKEFIEYQIICGTEPNICADGASTISSGSDDEIERPIIELD